MILPADKAGETYGVQGKIQKLKNKNFAAFKHQH